MKPYYEDTKSGIVIYHGDCRDFAVGANVVVTDPPYGIGITDSFDDNFHAGVEGFDEATGDRAAVFMSPRRVAEFVRQVDEWRFERALWMHKPGDIAHPWRGWHMNSEAILIFSRDGAEWPKPTTTRTDLYTATGRGDSLHPCEKSLDVVSDLVARLSVHTETILDPFMGSGTTLRAAKDLGRKAIGIEIEEKYCEIAAKRLSQEVLPFSTERAS